MQLARFLSLLAALCAFPAAAILIRADREDAEYVELATRYPQSIRVRHALSNCAFLQV